MTHYRSHQMRAFKASASAGNVIIVHSDDIRCESVATVPTGGCDCDADQIVFVGPTTSTCGPWLDLSPTALTYAETARMFPVIPSKPPLNRRDRRALKFKKGNR